MQQNKKFIKVVSLIVSVLFLVNNVSFSSPDLVQLQKASSLRERSAGVRGAASPVAGDIRHDLKDQGEKPLKSSSSGKVESAMLKYFSPDSTRDNEVALAEFLAKEGEAAIDEFVTLITEDRGISREEFGHYKIPSFTGKLPKRGLNSPGVDGKLYSIPCTKNEFEQERLRLMADLVIQRALGRKVVLAVGIGHVGTAMMCVTADATIDTGDKELTPVHSSTTKYRRPLKGIVNPYFMLGEDLLAPFAASKIFLVNQGICPIKTGDKSAQRIIEESRKRGNIRATWLFDSMRIPDIILIETAVHIRKTEKGLELSHAELEPTIEMFHQLGQLVPKEALLLIESTTFPGFTRNVAAPVIREELKKRGLLKEGEQPNLAYSPQVMQPGERWLQSLKEFPRQGAGLTEQSSEALSRYFSNVGFNFNIRPSTEWAEFCKVLDNGWYYSLLELMCSFMEAAEEFGLDGFEVARAIVKARPQQRAMMTEIPQMQVGGYCIPKDLVFMFEALRQYFDVSELEVMEIFRSRLVAANISDYRAEKVTDKYLIQALAKRGIAFDDSCVGIFGISYKGGIGDTRWTGSQRLAVQAAHYGAAVECTDPYSRVWPEIQDANPNDTTDWGHGKRNQQALKSMRVHYLSEPEGFYDFVHPGQDVLVLATPHAQYFGKSHTPDRRSMTASDGTVTTYPGLDPVKFAARMCALEGRTIVDTYDYLPDSDIKTFLALGWDVRAMGKGHIYGRLIKDEFVPGLYDKVTLEDRIRANRALLAELKLLLQESGRKDFNLKKEWLEQAIGVVEKKLKYLDAENSKEENAELLKAEYELAKASQELPFAKEAERPVIEARQDYSKAVINKAGDAAIRAADEKYKRLREGQLEKSAQRLAEIAIDPLRQRMQPLLESSARIMAAMAKASFFSRGERALRPDAANPARELSRIVASLKYLEEQIHRMLNDLDRVFEGLLTPQQRQDMLDRLGQLERRRHLALSGRATDITKMTQAEANRGWRIVLGDKEKDDPAAEKERIQALARQGTFVIYKDRVIDGQGKTLPFVPFTSYEQGPDGRLVKHEDREGFSRARAIKWVSDAMGGKGKEINPLWAKFMVKVPLNMVPVKKAGFSPELYENFSRLPLDMRQWLITEVFAKGTILSTVKGTPQSRYYLLMDVNLDPLTAAPGRGGILMDAKTDEPVVITTDHGSELVIMLKASGPYQEVSPADLAINFDRVIQGGRVEHELFTVTIGGKKSSSSGQKAEFEMYNGGIVAVPLTERCIAYIREGRIDTIKDDAGTVITSNFKIEEQGDLIIVAGAVSGEEIGRLKKTDSLVIESTFLSEYTLKIEDGRPAHLVNNTTGQDLWSDCKVEERKVTRTSKTAMGQIPGHTREAAPESVLELEGSDAYIDGKCARAVLRTVSTYEGGPNMEFQQLWRAVPSTRRLGWMHLGGNEDFNTGEMTKIMAWNAAEILAAHISSVHIAPNPDNIYSTGYYTDEDSKIPLFNERDPYGCFKKYFGYCMQLAYWNFAGAKAGDYNSVDLTFFPEWVNAFLDHLLAIRHGGRPLVRNPMAFQPLRHKAAIVDKTGLERFENELMDTLWREYLAYHVLANRIENGYDPTMESTYSSSEKKHRLDLADKDKAAAFIDNQRKLLLAAKRLVEEQGYDRPYTRTTPFNFEKALQELDRKAGAIEQLAAQPQRPRHFADIYNVTSIYPPLKPNVYSLLDFEALARGEEPSRLVIAQALPVVLREKVDISLSATLSSTESRMRDMFYEGQDIDQSRQWGSFSFILAYFNAWFSKQGPADIVTLQRAQDVYHLLVSDYMMSRQIIPPLSALGVIEFQSEPSLTGDIMEFTYKCGEVTKKVRVDIKEKNITQAEIAESKESMQKRLVELLRSWENFQDNRKEIEELTLKILGIKSPAEFRPIRPIRAITTAAGEGTRMGGINAKVLREVDGRPMIFHVLDILGYFDSRPIVVIRPNEWRDFAGRQRVGPDIGEEVKSALMQGGYNVEYAAQSYLKGDGHAIAQAKGLLGDFEGDVIVTWGDKPCIRFDTVLWLVMIHQALGNVPFSIAATIEDNPYVPIMTDSSNRIIAAVKGLNISRGRSDAGIYVGKARELFKALDSLKFTTLSQAMSSGEYGDDQIRQFLTDSFGKEPGFDREGPSKWLAGLPDAVRQQILNMEIFVDPYTHRLNKKGEINFVQIAAVLAKEGSEVIAPPLVDARERLNADSPGELARATAVRRQLAQELGGVYPPAKTEKSSSAGLAARKTDKGLEHIRAVITMPAAEHIDILSLKSHKEFFDQLLSEMKKMKGDGAKAQKFELAEKYIKWLIQSAFYLARREQAARSHQHRLVPNRAMAYVREVLERYENKPEKDIFAGVVERHLSAILYTIIEKKLDVYNRYFTEMASNASKKKAAEVLLEYAGVAEEKLDIISVAKAMAAYAVAGDIYMQLSDTETAAILYGKVPLLNKKLSAIHKRNLLDARSMMEATSSPRKPVELVPAGENNVYIGKASNRWGLSSIFGSDAFYSVALDGKPMRVKLNLVHAGGEVSNVPVVFSDNPDEPGKMPFCMAFRTDEPKIELCSVSNISTSRMQEVTIAATNISEVFSAGQDGKVFTDSQDPLLFLKYALFYTGIIGCGIDSVPNEVISAQDKLKAKKDPTFLAQLYYDKCPQQALEDIRMFTRNGGISVATYSPSAPIAAGFSSSSSVSIALLMALYSMSGQAGLTDPITCCNMALDLENQLGRGTGPQDTTGMIAGIKELSYFLEDGQITEEISFVNVPKEFSEAVRKRVLVFTPGISRQASKGIGERQLAFLLRKPEAFEAIQHGRQIHPEITLAAQNVDFESLGKLLWDYTLTRKKIHSNALPIKMEELFRWLLGEKELLIDKDSVLPTPKKPLICGGELVGAMGDGASALFIAPDSEDSLKLLEAALRDIIRRCDYFRNGSINFVGISDSGPSLETWDKSQAIARLEAIGATKLAKFVKIAEQPKSSSAGLAAGQSGSMQDVMRVHDSVVDTLEGIEGQLRNGNRPHAAALARSIISDIEEAGGKIPVDVSRRADWFIKTFQASADAGKPSSAGNAVVKAKYQSPNIVITFGESRVIAQIHQNAAPTELKTALKELVASGSFNFTFSIKSHYLGTNKLTISAGSRSVTFDLPFRPDRIFLLGDILNAGANLSKLETRFHTSPVPTNRGKVSATTRTSSAGTILRTVETDRFIHDAGTIGNIISHTEFDVIGQDGVKICKITVVKELDQAARPVNESYSVTAVYDHRAFDAALSDLAGGTAEIEGFPGMIIKPSETPLLAGILVPRTSSAGEAQSIIGIARGLFNSKSFPADAKKTYTYEDTASGVLVSVTVAPHKDRTPAKGEEGAATTTKGPIDDRLADIYLMIFQRKGIPVELGEFPITLQRDNQLVAESRSKQAGIRSTTAEFKNVQCDTTFTVALGDAATSLEKSSSAGYNPYAGLLGDLHMALYHFDQVAGSRALSDTDIQFFEQKINMLRKQSLQYNRSSEIDHGDDKVVAASESLNEELSMCEKLLETARVAAASAKIRSSGMIILDPEVLPDDSQKKALLDMYRVERIHSALESGLSQGGDMPDSSFVTRVELLTPEFAENLRTGKVTIPANSVLVSNSRDKLPGARYFINIKTAGESGLFQTDMVLSFARTYLSAKVAGYDAVSSDIKNLYQKLAQAGLTQQLEQAIQDPSCTGFELIVNLLPAPKGESIELIQKRLMAVFIASMNA